MEKLNHIHFWCSCVFFKNRREYVVKSFWIIQLSYTTLPALNLKRMINIVEEMTVCMPFVRVKYIQLLCLCVCVCGGVCGFFSSKLLSFAEVCYVIQPPWVISILKMFPFIQLTSQLKKQKITRNIWATAIRKAT